MNTQELREWNLAARINNEGKVVNVAMGERYQVIATRIAREGKMAHSVAVTARRSKDV